MAVTSHCARPGCGGVATAWLSYDYAGQRVWLDDPGGDSGGHHSALCAAHAARLRPPRGWSCQDRRTARPAFVAAGVLPAPGPSMVSASPVPGSAAVAVPAAPADDTPAIAV